MRHETPFRRRGFTIIEIIVVVSIIALLVAILIPAISRARTNAALAAAKAQIQSIQSALQAYYEDHHIYPPSSLPTGASYGTIPEQTGSVMLAQGLMGFLPAPMDGAGPDIAGGPSSDDKPVFGFRTRTSAMGGKIYGPYYSPTAQTYVRKGPFAIPGQRECFVDPWGHDILYFRGRGLPPPSTPTKQSFVYHPSEPAAFFTEDNAKTLHPGSGGSLIVLNDPAKIDYLHLIYPNSQTTYPNLYTGGPIMGADSFLLISGGPDEEYFTMDDILVTKP
jgi:prepilin-type N-terminal cleavage/methylation domain-containing protein